MGKSKSGGTRGFLRGKIANDVYSIGKDGNGKKQQVVRALAVSVANPRTTAQMRGRMIMSTVMQVVAGFAAIIDHSFDGVATGQPSISKFIRENYALLKADVAAHPSSGNLFGCLKYKERRVSVGNWKLSEGQHAWPSNFRDYETYYSVNLPLNKVSPTMADLREKWADGGFDYMTLVGIYKDQAVYSRITLNPAIADDTVITTSNIASCFLYEGNVTPTPDLGGDNGEKFVIFSWRDEEYNYADVVGAIFSFAVNGGYEHTTCALLNNTGAPDYNADTALPTYPTGTEQFLNGGEI